MSAYEKFEFDKILSSLSSFALTERGKKMALATKLIPEEGKLREEIAKAEETKDLLLRYERLPISSSADLSDILSFAKKGGLLRQDNLEVIANDILTSIAVKRRLSSLDDSFPLLKGVGERLSPLSPLEKAIHDVIAPDLSIRDDASPKLKATRLSISRLEASVKKKLLEALENSRPYLSSSTYSIKNGHYVLPILNSYKRKVKGLLWDISGSGETAYIEPEAVVSLNNRIAALHSEEKREIERLLLSLSSLIASNADELEENNAILGEFDFLMAKCLYGASYDGSIAHLVKEPSIEFLNARHPLIDKDKVVANDFHLDANCRIVVLSGPNAGGKTIALKTLGLLLLMAECALLVPAKDGAYFSYFHRICVDIGDNQSLSDNLSTYSAHLAAISDILLSVGGKDLVILDELGTGTSPKEGEAIAMGILSYLRKKRAFAMVSSHFEGLKAYALSEEGVSNASMLFDKERLLPTYRLKMGLPGESYGLELASRYKLPEKVLSYAKRELSDPSLQSVSLAIDKLSSVTKETEDLKNELLKEKAALAKEKNDLKSQKAAFKMKEDSFQEDLGRKKALLLEEYERKLSEIADSLRHDGLKLHEVTKAKHLLKEAASQGEEEAPVIAYEGPLKEGDYVAIPSLFLKGRLLSLQGEKALVQTPEGLSVKVKRDLLAPTNEPAQKEKKETRGLALSLDSLSSRKSVPLECNLIGMHIEEARLTLEKYVDDCLLRHYKRVRIIHGWGSGALRGLVRSYAEAHPEIILSFEGANGDEGGGGATIFRLK